MKAVGLTPLPPGPKKVMLWYKYAPKCAKKVFGQFFVPFERLYFSGLNTNKN